MPTKTESTYKSILIAVITAVITAILVSFINYFVWKKQNQIEQNQSLDNYKIELLEKFTKSSLTMISLCEHRAKIRMLYMKEDVKIQDSLKITLLPPKFNDKITYKLKEKLPIEFAKFEESVTYENEFVTNCILMKGIFSDEVYKQIGEFQNSLSDKFIINNMMELCHNKTAEILNADTDAIVLGVHKYQVELLYETLDKIYPEIDPSKRK
ncbi:MAG: hypothetical protein M0D53_14120 [Flavobacterium sp. JAD_PAG50586_2]|nr:MAG: hypothetical protein M0D53_14120 [Flavobacterium sp. JAD_PAG50586_2]